MVFVKPMKAPTEAEMAILGALWDLGPSTVREVHDVVLAERGTGYTTVLKLLQIMHDKGLVGRDTSARSHVYQAAVDRSDVQAQLVDALAARAFGGSLASLAMRALSPKRASAEEIEAVRAWLDAQSSEDESA